MNIEEACICKVALKDSNAVFLKRVKSRRKRNKFAKIPPDSSSITPAIFFESCLIIDTPFINTCLHNIDLSRKRNILYYRFFGGIKLKSDPEESCAYDAMLAAFDIYRSCISHF